VATTEVLSSRTLLRPVDFERSVVFYRDTLGLAVYREFDGGLVFFLGGGFLEVSGRSPGPASPNLQLWLQVRDVDAVHDRLAALGVVVRQAPRNEPWGLRECWIADPDGVAIALVQVPEDHPLRRR
jgi:catechol 2,3-dioxygenase-like lactoylglutathione lyase family enzyme